MNKNIEIKSLGVDNGRVIRAFRQEAYVLVSSEQTGDAFSVLRFFMPPGNVTPPHLHRTTDETFLIESGEIEINRGGKLLRGRKGDGIYLPKGIPHGLRVIGNEEAWRSWCAWCLAVLIVSLRLALKNSRKASQKCRSWSNWRLSMESSFKAVRRPESNRVPCWIALILIIFGAVVFLASFAGSK
jgi:quercetin dioxygenase-like cupin family protein